MKEHWTLDVTECAPIDNGLSIDLIRRKLVTDRMGREIQLFGEVGSTTDVLRRLAEAGAPEGTVVLAEAEAMGWSRLGRPWFGLAGLDLHAAVLCRPSIPPSACRRSRTSRRLP